MDAANAYVAPHIRQYLVAATARNGYAVACDIDVSGDRQGAAQGNGLALEAVGKVDGCAVIVGITCPVRAGNGDVVYGGGRVASVS
jgi:hypothetical protein